MTNYHKTAVLHIGSLGDMLVSLPSFRLLREILSDSNIYLYCMPAYTSLFKEEGIFNRIFSFRDNIYSRISNYDLIIDYTGQIEKGRLAKVKKNFSSSQGF